ncbi:type II toxin-antitoxin system mRNA interferase toxin, RelE/StbE family [Merismopedia glauca]|uniref:type II toxin-antitoxin system mRNA interferase toxin, RelE/StbE family n=1 Tax=Merismopedia glauca TaxID=292586 RepID=UPI001FEB2CB8|nr:type II toxin-antitoxin system mRNA interferase toxin, RelE/StbE family [Merismopedia glauca]
MAEEISKFQIRFSKKAQKDIAELTDLQKQKLKLLLDERISVNPYAGKQLKGQLKGLYSYRLNRKDRIVYEIYDQERTVLVIRARTHYGD